jgi:hypothetical protein
MDERRRMRSCRWKESVLVALDEAKEQNHAFAGVSKRTNLKSRMMIVARGDRSA